MRILTIAATFYGTQVSGSLAWSITDLGYGIMAWMNLAAILMLLKVGIAVLKDYERQKKAGLDPVFDPKEAGIKNANLWSVIKEKYLEQ